MGKNSIEIKTLTSSNTKEAMDFIKVPFPIYEGNSCWVPWFNNDMKQFIDRKHPVFEHTEGEFLTAYRNGVPSGRIFVFENGGYNRTHNKNSAYFFFCDFIDDQEVVNAFMEESVNWARKRGLESIIGPIGFGGVSGCGYLVHGYDKRAAMTMMMYNHPYYNERIEEFGFKKYLDNYSYILPTSAELPQVIKDAADKLLNKGGFSILQAKNKKELAKWAPSIVDVFIRTLSDHAGNYKLTPKEIDCVVKSLMTVARPELIKVVLHSDKVVGFLLGFYDLSGAIQKSRGKLNPLSIFRLLREYNRTDILLINGMGILPEYQGTGANMLLYSEMEKTIRAHTRFKSLEMVQIQEVTARMLSNVNTLRGEIAKIHRMYEYKL
ncbi:MAG TPA: hypothetical protein VIS94_13440 [Desulfomonilia bacterium]